MDLDILTRAPLNNEISIPMLGLGVYQTPRGQVAEDAVTIALDAGYRHIDTASMYGNEESVGRAILKSGISRQDIWVTTKLWNTDHGYERSIEAINESLERLNLDYIDLFLIHWPVKELRADSWKALEYLYDQGVCRTIGVSNYMIWHLEELLGSCEVVPAVNQVEFSPFLYQRDLLDFCNQNDIQLEAYSPLTKGERLNNDALKTISSNSSPSGNGANSNDVSAIAFIDSLKIIKKKLKKNKK